jgi:type IV pilus assembly protein PilW
MKPIKNNIQGFTLVELLIAALIGSLIVGATISLFLSQQKAYLTAGSQAAKAQSARMTVERVVRMVRQAGLDVVSGEPVLYADARNLTFRGDVDSDIEIALASDASFGDTEIQVDLDDGTDRISLTDLILIQSGETEQLVPVRSSGGPSVDLSSEPDVIYLAEPLTATFAAAGSAVRTVETTYLAYDPSAGTVALNGETLADSLHDLRFAYLDENGAQITIPASGGLTTAQRLNIRRVDMTIDVASPTGKNSKRQNVSIDPRNLDRPSTGNDVTAPQPPANLTITDDGCGQFTISFIAPSLNTDSSSLDDLGGFKVYFGEGSGDYYAPAYTLSDETQSSITVIDSRLTVGVAYHVAMTSYDTSFNEGPLSSEITFTLADVERPDAPFDLGATAAIGSVTLNWQAPLDAEDVSGYRIYRGTTPDFELTAPIADESTLDEQTFEFVDTDVESCRTYYYQIAAVDCVDAGDLSVIAYGDGDGDLDDEPEFTVTNTTPYEDPPVAPGAPIEANGTEVAVGGNELVSLMWTNPSDTDLYGVRIRFSETNFPQTPDDGQDLGFFVGQAGQPQDTIHEDRINGLTYFYSLFAFDHCGNFSLALQGSAIPTENGPDVQIVSPFDGEVISAGSMIYQATAADYAGGQGIDYVVFTADPEPVSEIFPKTISGTGPYCGLDGTGGAAQAGCAPGDVTSWCDGPYTLYATATNIDGVTGQSDPVTVTIANGGLEVDEAAVRSASGDYSQEINFEIENSALNTVNLTQVNISWNRANARLASIEIPTGTTVWSYSGDPGENGGDLELDDEVSVSPSQSLQAKLVFVHWFDRLTSSAGGGDDTLEVASPLPFQGAATVWLHDGSEATAVDVATVDASGIHLTSALPGSVNFSSGTAVAIVDDLANASMASAEVGVRFDYEKVSGGQFCRSGQFDVDVIGGPDILNVEQDQPTASTAASKRIDGSGLIKVPNNIAVPVRIEIVDHALSGIDSASVVVKYLTDDAYSSEAPVGTFATANLSASFTGNGIYEGEIPGKADTRVWFYFEADDLLGNDAREPVNGYFVYDAENTAISCPLNLAANWSGNKPINLTWDAPTQGFSASYKVQKSLVCPGNSSDSTISPVYTNAYSDSAVQANNKCYEYYIEAVDAYGDVSNGCSVNVIQAGDCSCL